MSKVNTTCNLLVASGLAIYAGAMVFGPMGLSVLGWCIFGPIFVGAVGKVLCVSYEAFKDPVANAANSIKDKFSSEKDGMKPEAAAAQ